MSLFIGGDYRQSIPPRAFAAGGTSPPVPLKSELFTRHLSNPNARRYMKLYNVETYWHMVNMPKGVQYKETLTKRYEKDPNMPIQYIKLKKPLENGQDWICCSLGLAKQLCEYELKARLSHIAELGQISVDDDGSVGLICQDSNPGYEGDLF